MDKSVDKNKQAFISCNIPFKEINEREILIKTQKADYQVSLSQVGNNPFVLIVKTIDDNRSEIISKEVFIRKLCRYFNTEFIHWDPKKRLIETEYTKGDPGDIVEGGEYTTTWADPIAKWFLKEFITDEDVILVSPKTNKELLAKKSDLRVWIKNTK